MFLSTKGREKIRLQPINKYKTYLKKVSFCKKTPYIINNMHQYKIKIGAIIKSSGNIAYIIIVARQKTKLPINTKKNKKNNSNANFLFSKRHVMNFISFGLVILKYIKMLINKIRQVTI